MATILGTVGVFGFDEDQQGILLESQGIDYKPDISMKGYIPRENPTDIRVAQTLTLANAAPSYGLSSSGTGTNVVTGFKIGLKNEDLATFKVTFTL